MPGQERVVVASDGLLMLVTSPRGSFQTAVAVTRDVLIVMAACLMK